MTGRNAGLSPSTRRQPLLQRLRLRVAAAPAETAARLGLALVLVVAGAFFLDLIRGTTFWEDEWQFLLFRQDDDLATFLDPHNGHLSLVPIAYYKLVFATAGLDHYEVFRITVVALHLLVVALLFAYASRRIAPLAALLVAVLMLFLGPGWQNVLWPFQMAWLVSLSAALGILLALDRQSRRGDVAAAALLTLALASSGLGLPLAAGVLVELLVARQSWRRLWIVALPLALWGLWYLAYGESNVSSENLADAPGFVADAVAGALAALTGLAGDAVHNPSHIPDLGRPLVVLAVGVLGWRVWRERISPRVAGLLTIGVAFWVLTALSRADLGDPYQSRYLYVGALVILLVGVELVRSVAIPHAALVVASLAVAAVVASNLSDFDRAGRFLRDFGEAERARAGALDIVRPTIDRDFLFVRYASWRYPAWRYYDAVDKYGSFGYSADGLTRRAGAGAAADRLMVQALEVALRPDRRAEPRGAPPSVDRTIGVDARRAGSCVRFTPTAGPGEAVAELTLPQGALRLEGASADVSLRRFGAAFSTPVRSVRDGTAAVLRVPRDLARQPWHARLELSGPAGACATP